jgi:hypothetical protein
MSRKNNPIALLRRAVELAMPNLRHYYRIVRKGRVVKSYASDGNYWADIQPLRNDESVDEKSPVIPMVEIPVIWAGDQRGVVCPPTVEMMCDIEYYDGDPDYPRISNFRWPRGKAPACELGAFIIQQQDGIYIKIDAGGDILTVTSQNIKNTAGANFEVEATGNVTITAGGNVSVDASGTAKVEAGGKVTVKGAGVDINGGGAMSGVVNGLCKCCFTGAPHPDVSSTTKASY